MNDRQSKSVEGHEQMPENEVEAAVAVTAHKTEKILAKAAKKGEMVEIGGEEIVRPEQALKNFQDALQLIRTHLGDLLPDVDLKDLQFKKMSGEEVGESLETMTVVDPILFRHPAHVLAKVIAHELLHKNTKIPNEGLVQAAVERVFGTEGVDHSYGKMVENIRVLAERFDKAGDVDSGIKKIYALYGAEDYEAIFEQYKKAYIDTRDSDEDKDLAFKFFELTFPELEYGGGKPGYATIKTL